MVNVKTWVVTKKQASELVEALLDQGWAVIKVYNVNSKLHREKGLKENRILVRAQRSG